MDFGPALNVSLTSVRPALANSVALRCRFDCFYEKVIKVKADVAALLCLISVLIACGTSGPHSLRLLVFLPFLFFVAFATFPHKIWR
jgi:hypothetical protein